MFRPLQKKSGGGEFISDNGGSASSCQNDPVVQCEIDWPAVEHCTCVKIRSEFKVAVSSVGKGQLTSLVQNEHRGY